MKRSASPPLIISGLFAVAELLWSISLTVSPEPFSPGSSALVVAGIVLYTVIAIVGMLLVRAPWARWLALTTAVCTVVVGALGGEPDPLSITAAVLSLVAIGGLAGPWLRIWLRQRPGAGAGPIAVALPLVAIAALPLAGLASVESATPAALTLAFAGPVLAWAYARGLAPGLWGLRLAAPALALIAAVAAGTWGSAAFLAYGTTVGILSWSPAARDAMSPVQAPLPPPRATPQPKEGR
jgi:hypothetical protein